jgi:hypothetical protein
MGQLVRSYALPIVFICLMFTLSGCGGSGNTVSGGPPPAPSPTPSPTPVAGTFTPASGSMATARTNHTATLFSDGSVFVVGGFNSAFNCSALNTCFVQTAEKFIPSAGSFQPGPSMTVLRNQHTATLLGNGQVLITGGNNSSGFLASAELFNPAAGAFIPTGSMAESRREHTATLLSDGRVLIAGGFTIDNTDNRSISSGEVYNPATGAFSNTGVMSTVRTDQSASLLTSGKVLIAGGNIPCTPTLCGTVLNAFATAELYDPSTNLFTNTGSMTTARFQHTSTLLPNGQVVIAGGQTVNSANTAYVPTVSIEIYDPTTGTFSPGGGLLTARSLHTATLLPNGQILFAGGLGAAGVAIKSAEIYRPSNHASTAVSDMTIERAGQTATLMQNGQIVVIGGGNSSATLGSAEIFK